MMAVLVVMKKEKAVNGINCLYNKVLLCYVQYIYVTARLVVKYTSFVLVGAMFK